MLLEISFRNYHFEDLYRDNKTGATVQWVQNDVLIVVIRILTTVLRLLTAMVVPLLVLAVVEGLVSRLPY